MRPGSAIVNVSSSLGLRAREGAGVYATAKAGQIGLTRQLAVEEGPRGVRANAVAPGIIETEMFARFRDNKAIRRAMIGTVPLQGQQTGTPEDVAAAVLYLCSPAARFINGQVITIDGGWSETHFVSSDINAEE